MTKPVDLVTCSVGDCGRPAEKRGWCATHYQRWRRTGSTEPPPKVRKECSVEGCHLDGKLTRGWCGTHYSRWRQHGDPLIVTVVSSYGGAECSIDGCTRSAKARGWCNKHWQRWQKHGDPLFMLPPHKPPTKAPAPCSIGDCRRPAIGRGWCERHYRRWQKHGDPELLTGMRTGAENRNWRGKEASYNAKHHRVRRIKGKAASCAWGCQDTYRYEWACMTGNYDDPDDYVAMCVLCHRRYDRAVLRTLND